MSYLKAYYPSMRMHLICKACRGNPEYYLDRKRCPLCLQNLEDYQANGLETEVVEFRHLHDKWLELKALELPTTGVSKLDAVLELLFGKPHKNNWRNYKLFPANESPFVVLRTVNIGRTNG